MSHIRTITYGGDPGWPIDRPRMAEAGRIAREVKAALEHAGFTVQTTRFASRPFGDLVAPDDVVSFAHE